MLKSIGLQLGFRTDPIKLELHKFYILATYKWHLESIIMETENKSYGKTKTNKTKRHIIYIAKM